MKNTRRNSFLNSAIALGQDFFLSVLLTMLLISLVDPPSPLPLLKPIAVSLILTCVLYARRAD